jgi:hypothetical protein
MDLNKENAVRARRLQQMVDSVGYENFSQEIVNDVTIPDGEEELPTDVDIGMAVDVDSSDSSVFRHLNFFEGLKSGLKCPICFGPDWTLSKMPKSEKLGCYYCAHNAFHDHERPESDIKTLKYQERPLTELLLNHVACVGRSSRGYSIPHSSFENLIKFSQEWSSFPHRLSHISNHVDCFGAHKSGLTNDDMPFTTRKSAENYKYQAIDDLVNRLQVISLPRHDKVTFIMYRISGLTCKVQNLLKLISDLELIHIPSTDVFCGLWF